MGQFDFMQALKKIYECLFEVEVQALGEAQHIKNMRVLRIEKRIPNLG